MSAMIDTQKEGEEQQVARGIRELLEWVTAVRLSDIPDAALRKAALVTADDMAAMVAATAEPEVKSVQDELIADGGRPEATVFRKGAPRTGRISAALANGIAGSWCELDEGYRMAPCHAGLYTLPALLAEAEVLDVSVEDFLRAAVLSYEVTARFARCWVFPQLALHPHPQSAAIGGAAASGIARGYDARQLADAVTSAATLITVGDYRHAVEGALVRNVWAAVGCTNGMRAADWARCGIGGLLRGPYAVYTELLGQAPDPQHLTRALGGEWAITQGYHKMHACCQSTHSAVEAMLLARERLPAGKSAANVKRVVLETHRPGMSNREPQTTLATKFSFEHVVAAACVYGHAHADAFGAESLEEPQLAALRRRIELKKFEPDLPRPHDRPARITLDLDDGTRVTAECLLARGGPEQPFGDGVILDKVARITDPVYPRFTATMRSIMTLDETWMKSGWRKAVAEAVG